MRIQQINQVNDALTKYGLFLKCKLLDPVYPALCVEIRKLFELSWHLLQQVALVNMDRTSPLLIKAERNTYVHDVRFHKFSILVVYMDMFFLMHFQAPKTLLLCK